MEPSNFPDEFRSISWLIDALIMVKNIENEKETKKLQLVSPIIKYFNEKVG